MKTDLVKNIEQKVKQVLQRHHVKRGGLFGSIATGNFNEQSDVDLLVELADGTGLLEFIQIKQELEDILQLPVDLVEYDAIKPILQKSILQQEMRIYG